MHLSMLSPSLGGGGGGWGGGGGGGGGGGYPREFDIMKLSQGRDFDI